MTGDTDYEQLEAALRRCGASWDAAQAHGLMTGRMSVEGAVAEAGTTRQILEDCDPANALRGECAGMLHALFESTRQALVERQSAFMPLLPDDTETTAHRSAALAHWCEGFLHGLVSTGTPRSKALEERLAAEPIADIIRDMLEMTRAVAADEDDGEEEAYAEVVEYLRVAVQLVYEELAATRPAATA